MFKRLFVILFAILAWGCSAVPSSNVAFNPDYYNQQQAKFVASQLTSIYKSSAFRQDTVVGEFKYTFPAQVKSIYWLGNTEPHNRPYDVTAFWIDPQGKVYFQQRCIRKDNQYLSELRLSKKKKPEQTGQWRLEVRGRNNEMLFQNRFYIGTAAPADEVPPEKAWTDPEYDIAAAPGMVLDYDVQVTVEPDFKISRRIYKKTKVLKEEGKSLAEAYEPYIDRQETVLLGFAQTILSNGKIVPQKDALYGTVMKVPPFYNPAKVIVIHFPSVEKDALMEYEMTFTETRPRTPGMFYDEFDVAQVIPVASARYSVTVPAGTELKYAAVRYAAEPVVTELPASKQRVYTWTFKNIRPVTVEAAMPPYRETGVSLVVSTTDTWEPVAAWWRDLTRLKYKTSDAIDEALAKLTKEKPAKSVLVDRIYKYVKDEIKFNRLEFGDAVYEPAPSYETLKSKSGDSKNQCVLLKTLLDLAGVEAHIGFVRTRLLGPVASGVTGAGEFNHTMVVAIDENGPRYLDPTGTDYLKGVLPPMDYGAPMLLIRDKDAELTQVPFALPASNGIMMDVTGTMDQEFNISGTVTIRFSGVNDGMFKAQMEEAAERLPGFISQTLHRLYPAATFGECKISNQEENTKKMRMSMSFTMKTGLVQDGNGRYALHMIGLGKIFPDYVLKDRKNLVLLEFPEFVRTNVKLQLPDNVQVEHLPEGQMFDNALLQAYTVYKMKDRGVVSVEDYIGQKKMLVTKEEYPLFLKSYEDYAAGVQSPVLLVPVQRLRAAAPAVAPAKK